MPDTIKGVEIDPVKEKLVELLCNAHSKSVEASAFDDATYAQQLETEADYLIANGVTVKDVHDTNVGEWISVKDRLPAPYVDVIACRKDLLGRANTVGLEYISITHDEIPAWNKDYMTWKSKVTHWMPLPQPPKGE